MNSELYPRIYLYRRIVQAKLFMDEYYAENIDLSKIADEAFFSRFHFIRLFKNIYSKTPHQYLTTVRIDNAKLLLQTGASVTEVCFGVGFESLTSFVGLFKRLIKLTPSAYQQQQQLRKQEIDTTPLKFIPHCFAANNGWTENRNFQEAI